MQDENEKAAPQVRRYNIGHVGDGLSVVNADDYDALKADFDRVVAERDALRAERDEARNKLSEQTQLTSVWRDQAGDMEAERDEARRERDAMQALLKKHGHHSPLCDADRIFNRSNERLPCSCGLAAALAQRGERK